MKTMIMSMAKFGLYLFQKTKTAAENKSRHNIMMLPMMLKMIVGRLNNLNPNSTKQIDRIAVMAQMASILPA